LREKTTNIFIIAGEASGDMHGAKLVESIKNKKINIVFSGIGGELLRNQGVKIINDYKEVNFIGFSSVIKNYSQIKSILNNSIEYIKKINPEIVILIDFPGFNLKFAESIRKSFTGKIIYYISPQVWAWNKSRVKEMKRLLDKILVIFPFEVDFYSNEGIRADYIGHPLVKRIDDFLSVNKKENSGNFRILLLPGTREEEIKNIFPVLATAGRKFQQEFDAKIKVVVPKNIDKSFYEKYSKGNLFEFIPNEENNNYLSILNSDLVLTKFGTSTLECALIGTPFITVYKANYFNYFVAKTLSNIKFVSLPNILMNKEIVKEFIQNKMTVDNIFNEGKIILFDKNYSNNIKNNFVVMKNIFKDKEIKKSAEDIIIGEL
jgi:lipid-A-disaccharide synthase